MITEMLVDECQVAEHLGTEAAQPIGGVICLPSGLPIGIACRIAVLIEVESVVPGFDCVGRFVRSKLPGLRDRRPRSA